MDKIDYDPIEVARIHMREDIFPVADTYLRLSLAVSMESVAKSLKILAGPQVKPSTEMQRVYARLTEAVVANDPEKS